jgi:rubrerythrin
MNTVSQTELLDLFITAESRWGELYALFAAAPGEHRELWEKMAADEKRHAAVLQELSLMVAAGEASFGEREMRTDVMKMFLDYVDVLASEARNGKIPQERALWITVDIERSYIERKTLNHFEGDTPAVAEALEVLREESFRHASEAEMAWLAARSR